MSPPRHPRISVILCTLATLERQALLERALASILQDQDGLARPVVVVNGSRYDARLVTQLRARSDIELLYREEPSLGAALWWGRCHVSTPYFATLDDDDELLPGGLPLRLEQLQRADADLVVTNGYYDDGHLPMHLQYNQFTACAADPLRSVLETPWLQSINALYRTDRLTVRDLARMPKYLEWTWLALKLARNRNIVFLDRPTYRLNRREADSLSFSNEFSMGIPAALQAALALDLPNDVKRDLRHRLSASLHNAAALALRSGDYRRAWRSHLASLNISSGWRWLLYTRRLLPRPGAGAQGA
jgi:glycosyltransferase involved in cell wall biosynthesis